MKRCTIHPDPDCLPIRGQAVSDCRVSLGVRAAALTSSDPVNCFLAEMVAGSVAVPSLCGGGFAYIDGGMVRVVALFGVQSKEAMQSSHRSNGSKTTREPNKSSIHGPTRGHAGRSNSRTDAPHAVRPTSNGVRDGMDTNLPAAAATLEQGERV